MFGKCRGRRVTGGIATEGAFGPIIRSFSELRVFRTEGLARRQFPTNDFGRARAPVLTGARANQITGLSEVFAFRCQFCGQGVGL